MKKTRKELIYVYILLGALITAATLKTVACFLELDRATGLFPGGVIIRIADLLTATAAVALASPLFGKKRRPVIAFGGPDIYLPGGAISMGLFFIAAELLIDFKESLDKFRYVTRFTSEDIPAAAHSLFTLLVALSALACILSFFYGVFYTKRENTSRAAFGIVATVFMAAYAAYLYFDTTLPINAPSKIADEMAFLFAAIFFDLETRVSLGRALPRAYLAFGLISAFLMGYSSIPALIFYFAEGYMISDGIAAALLAFTVFIYILIRVILALIAPEDKKCPAAEFVEVLSEVRTVEMQAAAAAREKYEALLNNIVENGEEDTSDTEELPEDGIGANYVMDLWGEGGEHIGEPLSEKGDGAVDA